MPSAGRQLHHEASEGRTHDRGMTGGDGSLILVATSGGPTMFARIGVMRALNRHVEREFNPSQGPSLGKAEAGARSSLGVNYIAISGRQCGLSIPKLPAGQGREFGVLHCKLGHRVQIEPGLQPQSPENGSFSHFRQRLLANPLRECPKSELGDWWLIRKNPPLAGLSANIRSPLSRGPDWLAGDAVLIAPVSARIPCKQGILQGILRFWASVGECPRKKPLCCSHYRDIPCAN